MKQAPVNGAVVPAGDLLQAFPQMVGAGRDPAFDSGSRNRPVEEHSGYTWIHLPEKS